MFSLDRVFKVYSGTAHRCMCGCAGKYTVARHLKDHADGHRGYPYDENEVNDRVVKQIVNKILRSDQAVIDVKKDENRTVESIHVTLGKRFYMAWLA